MSKVTAVERNNVYAYIEENRKELETYIQQHTTSKYERRTKITTSTIVYWLIFNEELNTKALNAGVSITVY